MRFSKHTEMVSDVIMGFIMSGVLLWPIVIVPPRFSTFASSDNTSIARRRRLAALGKFASIAFRKSFPYCSILLLSQLSIPITSKSLRAIMLSGSDFARKSP